MRLANRRLIVNRRRCWNSRIPADFTAYSSVRRRNFGAKTFMAVSLLSSLCSSSWLATVPRGFSFGNPLPPVLLRFYRILIPPLLALEVRSSGDFPPGVCLCSVGFVSSCFFLIWWFLVLNLRFCVLGFVLLVFELGFISNQLGFRLIFLQFGIWVRSI